MKRVAFQMKVKKEQLKEYVKWHENVWPEMIEALKKSEWKNYSLFMRKDGMIFGYVEVPDSFTLALDRMSGEEINDKWQDLMAPYFEIPDGTHPDENMIELEEIFCDVNPNFPNHHPAPTVDENLKFLIECIKKNNFDFGVAQTRLDYGTHATHTVSQSRARSLPGSPGVPQCDSVAKLGSTDNGGVGTLVLEFGN